MSQAKTSYLQGQRALSEQLRQSRLQSTQDRSSLEEQAYMTGKAINQGASARGVGTSGLKDLALVQAQLAHGKGVNQLAQQSADVQRAAMGTRLSLQEQLANANLGANAQYSQNMLDADKFALEQEQQNQSLIAELYNMAKSGSSFQDIKNLADVYGIDLQKQLGEGTLADALDQTVTDSTAPEEFKGKGNLIVEGYAGLSRLLGNILTLGTGDVAGLEILDNKSVFGRSYKYKYNINGTTVNMTPYDFANYLKKNVYPNETLLKSGEIKIGVDTKGDIKFVVNGQKFSSLSAAKTFYNKKDSE